jgi:hypothetical protein
MAERAYRSEGEGYYFDITNKEKIQISKSKPKKISILCTFKKSPVENVPVSLNNESLIIL